jgi:5-methyltetrahydropteroyltriglutamate--homocysteine methyltransferase
MIGIQRAHRRCGGTHGGSNGVDADVIWEKLKALADGAAIASKRYWP